MVQEPQSCFLGYIQNISVMRNIVILVYIILISKGLSMDLGL